MPGRAARRFGFLPELLVAGPRGAAVAADGGVEEAGAEHGQEDLPGAAGAGPFTP